MHGRPRPCPAVPPSCCRGRRVEDRSTTRKGTVSAKKGSENTSERQCRTEKVGGGGTWAEDRGQDQNGCSLHKTPPDENRSPTKTGMTLRSISWLAASHPDGEGGAHVRLLLGIAVVEAALRPKRCNRPSYAAGAREQTDRLARGQEEGFKGVWRSTQSRGTADRQDLRGRRPRG